MRLKKDAAVVAAGQVTERESAAELEAVNQWTKRPLGVEEVYLFAVRLCDNQVDRDGEFFDRAALEQLAPLFVGKSGIFDHSRSAKNQTARIYRTEVCVESGVVPESGEALCFLKGFAYMLRHAANESLIEEIEGGIKKEVSVSCAVARQCCSICGADWQDGTVCGHGKGQIYEGQRCAVRLCDPTDAYEWSFVAVPAQREAGVMKALAMQEGLEKFLEGGGELVPRWEQMQKEADCGRRYLDGLRTEVLRLGGLAEGELSKATLASLVGKLEEGELLEWKAVYEERVAKKWPIQTQLCYGDLTKQAKVGSDLAFCI